MKIFLTVLFAILGFLLFVILLLIPSRLIFNIRFDGNVRFTIKLLLVKFDFPVPVFYRPKSSEEAKKKSVKKEEEKSEKKPDKKQKKAKEKLPFPGIKKALIFVKDSLSIFAPALKNSFRLEKMDFRAIAASDNAASTSELYGVLCIVGTALHQFASSARGMKDKNVHVEIIPDFIAEKPDIYADIRFSIRIFRLLLLGKKGLSIFNSYKKLARETASNSQSTSEGTDEKSSETATESKTNTTLES